MGEIKIQYNSVYIVLSFQIKPILLIQTYPQVMEPRTTGFEAPVALGTFAG